MYLAKQRRSGVERYVADLDRNSPARLALFGELRRGPGPWRARAALPAEGLPGRPPRGRYGGAGPLAASGPRHAHAGGLHPGRAAVLPDARGHRRSSSRPRSRRPRCGARPALTPGVAQRLRPGPAGHRPGWTDRAVPEPPSRAARRAAAGDRRAGADQRARARRGDGRGAGRHRRRPEPRRLRHRLLLLAPAEAAAVQRGQGGRVVHGRMLESPDDEVVVKSILDLAAALGIRSVAEGVESAEVATALLAMGCVAAQGWHFARPMNAVSAHGLAAEHAHREPQARDVSRAPVGRRPRQVTPATATEQPGDGQGTVPGTRTRPRPARAARLGDRRRRAGAASSPRALASPAASEPGS